MSQVIEKEKTRIIVLDVLRGFAILGILLMNIQSFAMVGQAYSNPTAYGDLTGLNLFTWVASHVFADQKFMTIFSILFGASALMIIQGTEAKNHYSRNFWLLVFGLLHAYLIWYGDILTFYAICAFLLYFFRKLSTKKLWLIGMIFFTIASLLSISEGLRVLELPSEEIKRISNSWSPSASLIEREVNAYQGDYTSQFSMRMRFALMLQMVYFPLHMFWRIFGLMLIGMALFKSGFLSGKASKKLYQRIVFILGPIALLVVISGVIFNFNHEWKYEYSMYLGSQFNYWGSLGVSLAYISAIVLICNAGKIKFVTERLASIGRMALSNYLIQSILMAIIFYGFGLFGNVERKYQLLIVFAIWGIQFIYSPIWLKFFRYGPFEWIWRSLSRNKLERLIK